MGHMKSSIPISYHHNWKQRHTISYYVNYLVAFSQLKVIPKVHNPLYHWNGKFLYQLLSVSHFKAFFVNSIKECYIHRKDCQGRDF